jgi:hypothetical protein
MATCDFYQSLPAFSRFLDLANPANYVNAPADWYVLITDVVNSTEAIAQGRYKDVNVLGASSIMAVLNAVAPLEVPFLFGGDGATVLVPPVALADARQALLGVRAMAQKAFGLDLRVGVVPMAAIIPHQPVKVAKLRLTPTYSQASFLGGGITYATAQIKANATYRLDGDGVVSKANLAGLECRWRAIPSPKGHTLSLIVRAIPSGGQVNEHLYSEVLNAIGTIYGHDPNTYHPVALAALQLAIAPAALQAEVNARTAGSPWRDRLLYTTKAYLETLLGIGFMGFGLKAGGVDWGQYKTEVRQATDYRKIDDTLHMVISGSPAETQQLTDYLEQRFRQGHLAYGLHVSDRALMTCLIMNRRDRHFHLIDGADGGYALAAQQLKAKLKAKAQNWRAYSHLAKRTAG